MNKWNEIRTASKLAKLKTLSATAQEMGLHRSTVMRHIDVLEETLGVKLFQRNDKGYIPTEAGLEVMQLGEVTENHFSQLPSRLKSKESNLFGTLTITSVTGISSVVMPCVREYQVLYPDMQVAFIGDTRNFNLEYGEADIAIRAGKKPTTLDNIILPLCEIPLVLCAHHDYIKDYGRPTVETLLSHRFIALQERHESLVWNEWIHTYVPKQNIVILGSEPRILSHAVLAGCGIGVFPRQTVIEMPELEEIPTKNHWQLVLWTLTHRDMINTPKVRKFLDILKKRTEWSIGLI